MARNLSLVTSVLLVTWAAPALGVEVTGVVQTIGRGSRAPATTIVYAESLDGSTPIKPGRFKLAQKDKAFSPRILAVPVGSTVDFPNHDPIFHNVFSLSRPAPFDLGLYEAGTSKSRAFREPTIYRVFCNIHPQMTAVILVLPTSFITEAASTGSYRLELLPGRYRITAWSERAQAASAEITVPASGMATVPDIALDESKFVELRHQNKYGLDYPKSAYDEGYKP